MAKITLYSTGCPMCTVLEKKMKAKKIAYEVCSDTAEMTEMEFTRVPVLKVGDVIFYFEDAVKYINSL